MDNGLKCLSYDAIANFSEFDIHAFIYSTSPAGCHGLY